MKWRSLIDEIPLTRSAQRRGRAERCSLSSLDAFDNERSSSREVGEVNTNRWLPEIFEQRWFNERVDSYGRGAALTDSSGHVCHKAAGLVAVGE